MHGAHNTFVVLDERPPRLAAYAGLARRVCARGDGGFAADGLLVVLDPPRGTTAAAAMRVINADGSEAEMCGNGVRCVARYLAERGAPDRFTLATAAGPMGVEIVSRAPEFLVRVAMAVPQFPDAGGRIVRAAGGDWEVQRVDVGNPHAVIFVDDPARIDLERLGRDIGADALFPEGVNVHVVRRVDAHTLQVRHYERGVGLTQACGTGAVASAAAAVRGGTVAYPVSVQVPGGVLLIDVTPDGSTTMTGPAEDVLEREIAL
jgi:diaminopimelate epimerase